MKSRTLAKFCAKFISDKKCEDTVLLNVRKLTTVCEYMIIATVKSQVQMSAVVNDLIAKLKRRNIYPLRKEGLEFSGWTVLDYGSVIVHLMFEDLRDYYSLDKLWSKGRKLKYDKI